MTDPQEGGGRAGRVAALIADHAQVVINLGVVDARLRGVLDDGSRRFEIAHFKVGAAQEESMRGVLKRTLRKTRAECAGRLHIVLTQNRVELQEQHINEFVVALGQIQGLIAERDGLVEASERVNQHLGGVEDGLEIRVVEIDGLPVVLERALEVTVQRGDVAQKVVRLGRFIVQVQRAPGRKLRTSRVPLLDEVPAAVKMCGELVHQTDRLDGTADAPSQAPVRSYRNYSALGAYPSAGRGAPATFSGVPAGTTSGGEPSWTTTRVPGLRSDAQAPCQPSGICGPANLKI